MSDEFRAFTERAFDDPKVRRLLDEMTTADLTADLGQPEQSDIYAKPRYWKPGSDRPPLADPDPAVNAAIGKCATARMRRAGTPTPPLDAFHPVECGWCQYPLGQLLVALDWGLWHGRYLVASTYVWRQNQSGPGRFIVYARPTGRTGYQNPDWRKFDALPQREQHNAVERVRAG